MLALCRRRFSADSIQGIAMLLHLKFREKGAIDE
jgi:hypothetical protein